MSRTLTAAGAALLIAAAALGACEKKTDTTTNVTTNSDTVTTATTTVPEPTSGYAANAPVTVPEMKPTGEMSQAVRPGDPSKPSSGSAPVLAPTGNEREPYKPLPNGK